MKDCGYLNNDGSCNFTAVCEKLECPASSSNFRNVENVCTRKIEYHKEVLEKLYQLHKVSK